MKNITVNCENIEISNSKSFCLIAGPCQLETEQHAMDMAGKIKEITKKLNIGFIYKTSFDKANRTSLHGKRGMGIDKTLPIFAEIREKFGCPVTTDVHTAEQCAPVAEAVDMLQIPAFLCRQTDLLIAAAKTGKAINIKKGQFLPDIPAATISKILQKKGIQSNFDRELKDFALLTVNNASLQRLQRNLDIADTLSRTVFPIKIGNYKITIDPNPARLMSPMFDVQNDLEEPYSSFDHEDETKKSQKILDGLMQFGSFDKPKKELKVIVLCTSAIKQSVENLLRKIC